MIYLLVFLSGFAGLVYEVLWMKQLGLLFGNTSHAAATTFAAFFAGLALGSWVWGRRAARVRNPLKAYGWLEVAIAVSALFYFVVLSLFYRVYPFIYQGVDSSNLLLGAKFLLALLLVFPPAFFMGGTIPVVGQYVIRERSTFGLKAALLYGINTFGAASGAYLAGFCLPLWLGFRATCFSAMLVSMLVAGAAFFLARKNETQQAVDQAEEGRDAQREGRWVVLFMCFVSGFSVLALEVLWTRMFAQVLENSVYTFAAILVVVLVSLAAGSFLSSALSRIRIRPLYVLTALTLLGGLSIATTPFVFMRLTNGMEIIVSLKSWAHYVMLIFKSVVVTVAPPAIVLGMVFPYLMKTEEKYSGAAGKSLGTLAAVNTLGAIIGSLLCGFVLLEHYGMWRTMQIIAVFYAVAGLLIPAGWSYGGMLLKAGLLILLIANFSGLDPSDLTVNSVDPLRADERIVRTWEGSDCTVSVAKNEQGASIKINSHYGLGSTGAFMQERIQADLPLMIYPGTESVFFLGVGTGITAGSALDPQFTNVKRVVACELVPEVITAAKEYIAKGEYDFTGGLFEDPRATVLAEDGRHSLMASGEWFDMVNSDLFVPFRSGAGSLYSKEHFESVKASLEPGGVFVQWLPLYQVTEYELHVIARTMIEVFDQVSLWRNNFQPGEEVIAIAGHKQGLPLPSSSIDSGADKLSAVAGKGYRDLSNLALPFNPKTILFFYCGNLTECKELFADYPVNTDDRPVIEYMAPRTYRNRKDAAVPWFVGPRLAKLVDELQKMCPPKEDPLLVNRTEENKRLPLAGSAFHWARVWQVIGDELKCRDRWNEFVAEWTDAESKASAEE